MLKSRWSKVLGTLILAGAVAGFSGCNNAQSSADDPTDLAASELQNGPARGPMGEHGRKPHGGPAMLLGAALHELTLSDAQKTAIQSELDALKPSEDAKDNHEAARKAVADAVRSGKIDEAALLAQMPKPRMDTAKLAKAITVLHDTLTAEQRKELVEKMTARMEKMGGPEGRPFGGHGPKGDADRPENKGDHGPKGDKGFGARGPMGHLFQGIDLTDAQKETLRTAMEKDRPSDADREAMKTKHEAMRATMKERLATFASDKFDANAFVTPPADAPKMGPEMMFGRMIKGIAALVPTLTEAQRATLASNIEAAPMGPPHMGKGHHGPDADDAE